MENGALNNWMEDNETAWTVLWNRNIFPITDLEDEAVSAKHAKDLGAIEEVKRKARTCIVDSSDPLSQSYIDLITLCEGFRIGINNSISQLGSIAGGELYGSI